MKKLILAIAMILTLTACGASEPEHSLEFIEGKLVTMEDGTELVGVFCTYTNMSDESCLPCDAINIKAFQNGTEIPVMVYTGQKTEGAIQCDTTDQAGKSATVVWTFQREDNSTVSVEFTDGQEFSFDLTGG